MPEHEVDTGFEQEQESLADRYMNPGGGLSGASRGSRASRTVPQPTVSIPYGEDQGGVRDFFRKMKGKVTGKQAAAPDPATQLAQSPNTVSNPLYQPANDSQSFNNPLYEEPDIGEAPLPAPPPGVASAPPAPAPVASAPPSPAPVAGPAPVGPAPVSPDPEAQNDPAELREVEEELREEEQQDDSAAVQGAQSQTESDQDDEQPARGGDADIAANHKRATALTKKAINKHRRGLGLIKDGKYAEVRTSVSELASRLASSFPANDPAKYRQELTGIIRQYDSTLFVLHSYIGHIDEKGGGKSLSGGSRYDLVKDLIACYEKDKDYFSATAEQLASADTTGIATWDDILYNARVLDLTNTTDRLETVGAGSSVITKRTKSDNSTEYIKKEERTTKLRPDMNSSYTEFRAASREMLDLYQNSTAESKAIYEEMLNFYREHPQKSTKGKDIAPVDMVEHMFAVFLQTGHEVLTQDKQRDPGMSDDEFRQARLDYYRQKIRENDTYPRFQPFFDHLMEDDDRLLRCMDPFVFTAKKQTEANTSEAARITPGSTISDRNVSTSILAGRLGVPDLVAKSETVLVKNGEGGISRANSMEGVNGKVLKEWDYLAKKAEQDDAKEKAKNQSTEPKLSVTLTYTPKALMQLGDLMILDVISGQVDRNMGNYIAQVEKTEPDAQGRAVWYITSIKGIDNDMAFGTLSMEDIMQRNNLGEMKTPVDHKFEQDHKQRQQHMQYMSREMFDRIHDYTPDMAALDQQHLRSGDELEALKQRLQGVRDELDKLVSEGRLLVVSGDNDEEMQAAYNATMENGVTDSSYIALKFLNEAGASYTGQ